MRLFKFNKVLKVFFISLVFDQAGPFLGHGQLFERFVELFLGLHQLLLQIHIVTFSLQNV